MVAALAHLLGSIENNRYGANIDLGDSVLRSIYHDLPEAITGDIISGTKKKTEDMRSAAKAVEKIASKSLLEKLPDDIKQDFEVYLLSPKDLDTAEGRVVEAADAISAYIKAKIEGSLGNTTYRKVLGILRADCEKHIPNVRAVQDVLEAIDEE